MKKIVVILLTALVMSLLMSAAAQEKEDIILNMRFYEGKRIADRKVKAVVSSYTLKPMFVGNIRFMPNEREDASELLRIFNLKKVEVLNETQWGWRSDEKKKVFEIVILNSHKFFIYVSMIDSGGKFELKVVNDDTGKILLKTVVVLPEKRSSVFGFEDSSGRPFFLSLSRAAGESVIRKEKPEKIMSVRDPVLIKRVLPVYPKAAVQARVSGNVRLEAVTNRKGVVETVTVIRGNPILSRAAVDAMYQWRYKPYIVNGIPQRVKFYVVVRFNLDRNRKQAQESREKILPAVRIPDIWPVKGYLTSGFGWRINPVTKKRDFHKGQDIAAKKGTAVIAPAGGIITFAGPDKQYGKLIIIDHQNGYTSQYGQLSEILVGKGDRVKKRQIIGKVGSSGISTGPHLHWEVHFKGKPVNPAKLIVE